MTDRPTAAPAIWPYPHRTLEQVRIDEETAERRAPYRAVRGAYGRKTG